MKYSLKVSLTLYYKKHKTQHIQETTNAIVDKKKKKNVIKFQNKVREMYDKFENII